MQSWDSKEEIRQAQQTLAILRTAAERHAYVGRLDINALVQWQTQSTQAIEELKYIIGERRFPLALRQQAGEIRDQMRASLGLTEQRIRFLATERTRRATSAKEVRTKSLPIYQGPSAPVTDESLPSAERISGGVALRTLRVIQEALASEQGKGALASGSLTAIQERLRVVQAHLRLARQIYAHVGLPEALRREAITTTSELTAEEQLLQRHVRLLERESEQRRAEQRARQQARSEIRQIRARLDVRRAAPIRDDIDRSSRIYVRKRHARVMTDVVVLKQLLRDMGGARFEAEIDDLIQTLSKEGAALDRLMQRFDSDRSEAKPQIVRSERPGRAKQQEQQNETPVAPPPTTKLPFTVLGGERPSFAVLRNHYRLFHETTRTPDVVYDYERLQYLCTFEPIHGHIGHDEFDGYFVLEFPHYDCAAFECPRVGNALYLVCLDEWQIWARKSKSQLWHDDSGAVRRVLHAGEWRERVRAALEGWIEQSEQANRADRTRAAG